MRKILHTPEGVRDIYNEECEKKRALERKLCQVLHSCGYRDIETPTFEFFDVFSGEVGTIPSRELYKFFDREGNTLVLRPDFTPAIARAAARYFVDEKWPIRLCYLDNIFVNNSSYQGRLKENTEVGAELIGDGTPEADAEIIAMVVNSLLKAGLKEFQVSIGHVQFFTGLSKAAGLDGDTAEELKQLIKNRNNFGVEKLLDEKKLPGVWSKVFGRLPALFGGEEVLAQARELLDLIYHERKEFEPGATAEGAAGWPDGKEPCEGNETEGTLELTGEEKAWEGAAAEGTHGLPGEGEQRKETAVEGTVGWPDGEATRALDRLEEVLEILKIYGLEKYVSFDLGMNSNYMYYTGIIFRGYTYGTGDAIVKGGRYDGLLSHFGKEAPAIGFVAVVNQLMSALARQKIEIPTEERRCLILYRKCDRAEAIRRALECREEGYCTELVQLTPGAEGAEDVPRKRSDGYEKVIRIGEE